MIQAKNPSLLIRVLRLFEPLLIRASRLFELGLTLFRLGLTLCFLASCSPEKNHGKDLSQVSPGVPNFSEKSLEASVGTDGFIPGQLLFTPPAVQNLSASEKAEWETLLTGFTLDRVHDYVIAELDSQDSVTARGERLKKASPELKEFLRRINDSCEIHQPQKNRQSPAGKTFQVGRKIVESSRSSIGGSTCAVNETQELKAEGVVTKADKAEKSFQALEETNFKIESQLKDQNQIERFGYRSQKLENRVLRRVKFSENALQSSISQSESHGVVVLSSGRELKLITRQDLLEINFENQKKIEIKVRTEIQDGARRIELQRWVRIINGQMETEKMFLNGNALTRRPGLWKSVSELNSTNSL